MHLLHRPGWGWLALFVMALSILLCTDQAQGSLKDSLSEFDVTLPMETPIDLDKPIRGEATIKETFQFFGLAGYLNNVTYYLVDKDVTSKLTGDAQLTLREGQFFVVAGRFNALVVHTPDMSVRMDGNNKIFLSFEGQDARPVNAWMAPKAELGEIDPSLNQLRYIQLPTPLALLARSFEWLLVNLQAITHLSWGLSLIVFAILIKLLLTPVTNATKRLQSIADSHHQAMKPEIQNIKKHYRGEEAHHRLMALYKARKITPFYTLKPMLGLFIQIPVLIAVFNVLAETHQFSGQSFMWASDLATPDGLATLPFTIPLFGNTLNVFPILMALVAAVSALKYSPKDTTDKTAITRKRLSLLSLAVVFLLFFYPFPATMTLYWLLANLFHAASK